MRRQEFDASFEGKSHKHARHTGALIKTAFIFQALRKFSEHVATSGSLPPSLSFSRARARARAPLRFLAVASSSTNTGARNHPSYGKVPPSLFFYLRLATTLHPIRALLFYYSSTRPRRVRLLPLDVYTERSFSSSLARSFVLSSSRLPLASRLTEKLESRRARGAFCSRRLQASCASPLVPSPPSSPARSSFTISSFRFRSASLLVVERIPLAARFILAERHSARARHRHVSTFRTESRNKWESLAGCARA